MKLRPPPPTGDHLYSERFVEALQVAAQMHAAQGRKGTTIPYVSHLLGTCSIALEYGATEEQAIAALLHDAIEDLMPVDEVTATVGYFGEEVLRIVEACTDAHTKPKPPWLKRKKAYIARLEHEDEAVVLVSASDKLHNARAIVRDLRDQGDSVWRRFNAGKDGQLWYYRALVRAFRKTGHHRALVKELDRTVKRMKRLAGKGAG